MTHEITLLVLQKKLDQDHGLYARRKLLQQWTVRSQKRNECNASPHGCYKNSGTSCNHRSHFTYQCHKLILDGEINNVLKKKKKKRNKEENRALEERHSQFFLVLISSTRFQDNFLGTTKHSAGLGTVGFIYCTLSTTKASGKHSKPPTVQPLEQKITRE